MLSVSISIIGRNVTEVMLEFLLLFHIKKYVLKINPLLARLTENLG